MSIHRSPKIPRRSKNKPKLIVGPNYEPRRIPEADMPVPDRLLPKGKLRMLVHRLKLSQAIGLLLYLNREELLSSGGKERLLFLQSKAPFSAIEAGLRFAQRLEIEKKLQSDFKHQMIELNRRPHSRRYRRYEASRIGIGYRDKGTLPKEIHRGIRPANEEAFVFFEDLPRDLQERITGTFPTTREGEWVDWEELDSLMKINGHGSLDRQLLFQ